jgi:hypothetical protein
MGSKLGGHAMDELVKVLLYRGEEQPEGLEINRDAFQRALDELFEHDNDDMALIIGNREIRGVTNLVLASLSAFDDEVPPDEEEYAEQPRLKKAA